MIFNLKRNKGITLIALVITIIVLLILAGVSIATLTGDNGLLSRANNSKEVTEKSEAEERIKLIVAEWELAKKQPNNTLTLEEFLNSKVTTKELDKVTKNADDSFTLELKGYEAIINENGQIVGEIQKAGSKPTISDIKITIDGTNVPADKSVEEGTPLKISFIANIEGGNITSITPNIPYTTTGTEMEKEFIIIGNVNGVEYTTKRTISVKEKYKVNEEELIVPKIPPTGDLADTSKTKEVREGNIPIPVGFDYVKGSKIGGAVITDGNSEFVWIPVDNPSEMYGTLSDGKKAGKLYDLTSTESKPNNWIETNGVMNIIDINRYREPYVLGNYDNDIRFNNGLFTKETLQQEFDEMIESVIKYKGFYIGRYEMSLDNNKKAQSKKGETSANAFQSDTNRWYGLYGKAKTYEKSSIKSTMMWGSQYDTMLKWMQKNNIDISSKTPILGATSSTIRITGNVETDKLNNIYDILGNSAEWTLEAYDAANNRTFRSGDYKNKISPSYRTTYYPFGDDDGYGSRITFYIK